MAKKKRKLTPTQNEYNKQRKRIQNFLSKAQKRGYIFPENILPSRPKRITKASVTRLAKLTPAELYKKAQYGGVETYGEIVPASEGLKLERQARAKKATETRKKKKQKKPETSKPQQKAKTPPKKVSHDVTFYSRVVIGSFLSTINSCQGGQAREILMSWFNRLRSENGDDAVAHMIERASENGYELTWEAVYNVEKATDYMHNVIQFLSEQGDFYKDNIDEYIDMLSRMENVMYEESNFDIYD